MSDYKFHITPKRNLISIISGGLKINSKNCMSHSYKHFEKTYGVKPIFLTDDPVRLAKEQLTPNWIEKNFPLILSVDVTSLDLIPEYDCVDWVEKPISPDFTWISLKDIEPSRLKIKSFLKSK